MFDDILGTVSRGLGAIGDEVTDAGRSVGDALRAPVSKGVDVFCFVDDGLPADARVEYVAGDGDVGRHDNPDGGRRWGGDHLEVRPPDDGDPTDYVGSVAWQVVVDGTRIARRTNRVSALTGDLQPGSEMADMLRMPPESAGGYLVDYGFYDAGRGGSGLTDHDQMWVYVTRDLSDWMRDVVASVPGAGSRPFRTFVLPGAHDAGMNTMDVVDEVSAGSGEVLEEILRGPAGLEPTVDFLAGAGANLLGDVSELRRVVEYTAITQKDRVADMLRLGCRYLDVRPGAMHSSIRGYEGRRFHQHMVIPGTEYRVLLRDVLTWLGDHPGEIVVVTCSAHGFSENTMIPTVAELDADWQWALQAAGSPPITCGGRSSLDLGYDELCRTGTRVVVLHDRGDDAPDHDPARAVTLADSYSDDRYFTLDPGSIVEALGALRTEDQEQHDLTMLQLQGTCTFEGRILGLEVNGGQKVFDYTRFLSESDTAAPLMSTKARFDAATLPWVREHGPANLRAERLVVLLNDFVDNATASAAIGWTRERLSGG